MSFSTNSKATAADFIALKDKVNNEIMSRTVGLIPFTEDDKVKLDPDVKTGAKFNPVSISQLSTPLNKIEPQTTVPIESGELLKPKGVAELEAALAKYAKDTNTNSSCRAGCTGLCITMCANGCKGGCKTGCGSGCQGCTGCSGSSGCSSCSGCSGCSGGCGSGCVGCCSSSESSSCYQCTNCSSGCEGGCSGCGGTCGGSCSGCKGGCKGGCIGQSIQYDDRKYN